MILGKKFRVKISDDKSSAPPPPFQYASDAIDT